MAANKQNGEFEQYQRANQAKEENSKIEEIKFEIISVKLINRELGYKKVVFRKGFVHLSNEGSRTIIEIKHVLKIHVQEAQGTIVLIVAPSENNNPAQTYRISVKGCLSDLLAFYPNDLVLCSDYHDLLTLELTSEPVSIDLKYSKKLNPSIRDYSLLDAGDWMNDELVMWSLETILNSQKDSLGGAKVSIINQTIVNSLSRTSRENFEKTASRYHKQKRFFEDDFIVTPLNISNEHWVLLIVCYPGLDGCYDIDTGERCHSRSTEGCIESYKNAVGPCSSPFSPFINPDIMSGISILKNKKLRIGLDWPPKRVRVKQPCILVFDSSINYGERLEKPINVVKNYLAFHINTKGGSAAHFCQIPVHFPVVPRQQNNNDCGLYVIHYFYEFLEFYKSDKFDLSLPINQLKDSTTVEKVVHTKQYLAKAIREMHDPSQLFPLLTPSDVLYTKIPDRDDDGLAE